MPNNYQQMSPEEKDKFLDEIIQKNNLDLAIEIHTQEEKPCEPEGIFVSLLRRSVATVPASFFLQLLVIHFQKSGLLKNIDWTKIKDLAYPFIKDCEEYTKANFSWRGDFSSTEVAFPEVRLHLHLAAASVDNFGWALKLLREALNDDFEYLWLLNNANYKNFLIKHIKEIPSYICKRLCLAAPLRGNPHGEFFNLLLTHTNGNLLLSVAKKGKTTDLYKIIRLYPADRLERDINEYSNGMNALCEAIMQQDKPRVKMLLEHGALPCVQKTMLGAILPGDRKPLLLALYFAGRNVAYSLRPPRAPLDFIDMREDLQRQSNGQPVLSHAEKIVALLIDKTTPEALIAESDSHILSEPTKTPEHLGVLYHAAGQHNTNTLALLIEKGGRQLLAEQAIETLIRCCWIKESRCAVEMVKLIIKKLHDFNSVHVISYKIYQILLKLAHANNQLLVRILEKIYPAAKEKVVDPYESYDPVDPSDIYEESIVESVHEKKSIGYFVSEFLYKFPTRKLINACHSQATKLFERAEAEEIQDNHAKNLMLFFFSLYEVQFRRTGLFIARVATSVAAKNVITEEIKGLLELYCAGDLASALDLINRAMESATVALQESGVGAKILQEVRDEIHTLIEKKKHIREIQDSKRNLLTPAEQDKLRIDLLQAIVDNNHPKIILALENGANPDYGGQMLPGFNPQEFLTYNGVYHRTAGLTPMQFACKLAYLNEIDEGSKTTFKFLLALGGRIETSFLRCMDFSGSKPKGRMRLERLICQANLLKPEVEIAEHQKPQELSPPSTRRLSR